MLVFSAFSYAQGQIASATPDPFAAQLTSSPAGFYSYAGDVSGNGRFVVFESIGDVATEKIPSKNPDGTTNPGARNNEDGNREIFLIDYAQRRIFQITDTKNVQKPPASPTPTPTPTATPTPSPGATPTPSPVPTPPDLSLVRIEISNNHPMISFEPVLVGGKRVYTIVFSSNAPDPRLFDGVVTKALTDDANNGWNQEVWTYQLPETDDNFDLSNGDEVPFAPLASGTFERITNTVPSRPLIQDRNLPDVVDDNRDATISDDGRTLAFISTRDLVPTVGAIEGNGDFNPELFFSRTTAVAPAVGFSPGTFSYVQGTRTKDDIGPKGTFNRFQQNPSLSANGNVVAFISTANLATAKTNNDDGGTGDGHGNAEVYVADFTGTGLDNIRQITKTKAEASGTTNAGLTLNLLSAGRRLSRDGAFVAYESRADDPTANSATNTAFLGVFVSKTSDSTFKFVGPRALDVIHFPTFTDYDGAFVPHALVFSSNLNFKADGTLLTSDQDTTGLNPSPTGFQRQNQLFSTPLPITSATSSSFTRLTKNPAIVAGVVGIRGLASNTQRRIAFTVGALELGGGNADGSSEVFYLLTPPVIAESPELLSYYTFASNYGPLATVTAPPSPTPTPTPTPTPSPGVPAGLAPGETSIVRSTVGFATSDKTAGGGPEATRSPILPVELNGISVSVGGAAAGLYFVGDSPSEGIHFVVPVGLAPGIVTFVINNRGNTVFRGFVQIVASQPDIFSSTGDAGGNAIVCNVTNAASGCTMGPFQVTSSDGTAQVPTRLQLYVTGTRFALATETKVSFVNGTTTTDITPSDVRPNTNMFGYDLITFTLPASLAGMAPIDYKVIVTVTKGVPFTSRPEATAPTITIIP
jgi:uncharacterized protein (TIGR03437 family)